MPAEYKQGFGIRPLLPPGSGKCWFLIIGWLELFKVSLKEYCMATPTWSRKWLDQCWWSRRCQSILRLCNVVPRWRSRTLLSWVNLKIAFTSRSEEYLFALFKGLNRTDRGVWINESYLRHYKALRRDKGLLRLRFFPPVNAFALFRSRPNGSSFLTW